MCSNGQACTFDSVLPARIDVAVIGPQGLLRDGLCAMLADERYLRVVTSAACATQADAEPGDADTRLVILDADVRHGESASTLQAITSKWPKARVLVLTSTGEKECLESFRSSEVKGYLLKSDDGVRLRDCIRAILAGHHYVSPGLQAPREMARQYASKVSSNPATPFTDRERDVMRLIATGRRTREIAITLCLSHKTVEKYRSTLMRKLGVRSAPAVAAYAIANGYADLSE